MSGGELIFAILCSRNNTIEGRSPEAHVLKSRPALKGLILLLVACAAPTSPTVTITSPVLKPAPVQSQPATNGLLVRYFNTPDFTGSSLNRTEASINFDWGSGSPDPSIATDSFSLRAFGQVQAKFTQTYTFQLTTDDAVRLWINGQLIVDQWNTPSQGKYEGLVNLKANQKYTLRLDYLEHDANAKLQLAWSSPSQAHEIVPQAALFPAGVMPEGPAPSSLAYTGGRWGNLIQFPLIPVAAAGLPDGRVLIWSAYDKFDYGGSNGFTQTAIFNPSTGQITEREVSSTNHDMFCPGTAMLTDGRVLVTGGSNSEATSIYNPTTDTWTRDANLNVPRGYNTAVTLFDGRVLTLGGTWRYPDLDKYGEIWTAGSGWKSFTGASMAPAETGFTDKRGNEQMWLIPSPDGRVLSAGPSPQMQWYDFSGNGSYTPAGTRSSDLASQNAAVITYETGKVLKAGGQANYGQGAGNKLSYVLDMNTGLKVRAVDPMKYARAFATGALLPNGEVLVVGGNTSGKAFSDEGSILTPELWNPKSEQWKALNDMQVGRNYHSIALLLPDARVLSAGGGLCGDCQVNHPDGQVFSPPYLFNPDGTAATRPVISSVSGSVKYGQAFNVSTDSPVNRLVLIRMSSVTHTMNTDQRLLELVFTGSNTGYNVVAPSGGVAVPGNYMLFALSSQGVPSVSKVVRVGL
jgi:PA14 domain/Domain of unknown function (DUF1929)